MRLSELRSQLQLRNLSTDGNRELLELRLRQALYCQDGIRNDGDDNARVPLASASVFAPSTDWRNPFQPKTVQSGNSLSQSDVEMSTDTSWEGGSREVVEAVDSGNQYPPPNGFFPLNNANPRNSIFDQKQQTLNRLGSRLGPLTGGRSLQQRLDQPIATVCSNLEQRLGTVNFTPSSITEKHQGVFDDTHKQARAKRFKCQSTLRKSRGKISLQSQPKLYEVYQKYDVERMRKRAKCYSDVSLLKRRAGRFDEECANELVQVREARTKNERLVRFGLEDEASSSMEMEGMM